MPRGPRAQGVRNRVSLNLSTIQPAPFERKLHAAGSAGFSAVGLLAEEMQEQGEAGLEELLLSELAVSEMVGVSGWMDAGQTARALALVRAEEVFRLAAQAGCSLVIAWPPREAVEPLRAATYLADLCRAAQPFGVGVGIEFMADRSVARDLASAWTLIQNSEAENAGVVIDTFHFHVSESTEDMLALVPGERILLVQVSDCPDLPRWELEDRHRLYPGTGSLPLEPLLAAIQGKGYSGHYSLEVPNEHYWAQDPMMVAAEGFRAMRRLDLV